CARTSAAARAAARTTTAWHERRSDSAAAAWRGGAGQGALFQPLADAREQERLFAALDASTQSAPAPAPRGRRIWRGAAFALVPAAAIAVLLLTRAPRAPSPGGGENTRPGRDAHRAGA